MSLVRAQPEVEFFTHSCLSGSFVGLKKTSYVLSGQKILHVSKVPRPGFELQPLGSELKCRTTCHRHMELLVISECPNTDNTSLSLYQTTSFCTRFKMNFPQVTVRSRLVGLCRKIRAQLCQVIRGIEKVSMSEGLDRRLGSSSWDTSAITILRYFGSSVG